MSIYRPNLYDAEKLNNLRIKGGANFSLENIKPIIEAKCAEYGINVIVSVDSVDSGKIFDRSTTPCIVVRNAEHKSDYDWYVFTMQKQGIYAFLEFYIYANSENTRKINQGTREHSTITGMIFGAITKASVKKDAYEAELQYYSILEDVINDTFSEICG